MTLEEYRKRRRFKQTPEPQGAHTAAEPNQWRFVLQLHDASRLHYDLRLELDGVLLSWALPKGPTLDPAKKRLAVQVEDHPLEYLEFEGIIPEHEYGAGTVMVWDLGHWTPREDARQDYARGELKFDLQGEKISGGYMLVRLKPDSGARNQWLLIKEKDQAARPTSEFDVVTASPRSVLTGRTLREIARDRDLSWSTGAADHQEALVRDLAGHGKRKSDRHDDVSSTYHFPAEQYPAAKRAPLPARMRPCLPTATRQAPTGDDWVHELKYDGYRMLCFLDQGRVRFVSRNGRDWSDKLPTLSQFLASLTPGQALLDGEVVMLTENGTTSFQALQNRIGAGRDGQLRYYVFDLLYLEGYDLRPLTLLQRKQILHDLIQGHAGNRLVYSEHLLGEGPTIFRQACQLGAEGIVSKRASRRYGQGRVDFWLKTKCLQSREFIIGGFTPPTASRRGLGAILLGALDEEDRLQFVGKVGTGFTMATLVSLREQLDARRVKSSPFANLDHRNAEKGTIWVEPNLVAEVEFAGWTEDGAIRFGSFKGLRDDVAEDEIDCTLPSSPRAAARGPEANSTQPLISAPPHPRAEVITLDPSLVDLPPELATLKLTHPQRVIYPERGITKLGLATYYAQVSRWMLPHIAGRPVSLLRCPGGVNEECFFQKRAPQGLHESVERIQLEGRQGQGVYLVLHDMVGLLALVQFGVLEFHVAGAKADRYDRPDRIVFDLDPDEQLPWPFTTRAAFELRDWLAEVGLVSFVKTTGGKGLHILLPIRRRHSWEEVKRFSRKVATLLAGRDPNRFTTHPAKAERRGRILIDVLRNTRGATTVAAYSTRAKPHASVSVPLAWDELSVIGGSDSLGLQDVVRRLADQAEDPWRDVLEVDQGLSKRVWARF